MPVNTETKSVHQDGAMQNDGHETRGEASPGFGRGDRPADEYGGNEALDDIYAELVNSYGGRQYEEASQGARKNDPGQ